VLPRPTLHLSSSKKRHLFSFFRRVSALPLHLGWQSSRTAMRIVLAFVIVTSTFLASLFRNPLNG
jgi:hypothetical protein